VPPDPSPLELITQFVPHNQALGLRFVSVVDACVTMALPYDPKIVGNPITGVIHGGAITSLLDATCGLAVLAKLDTPMPVATLDLRIDYLRPATPQREVHARAECFKVTKQIAFVRCEAFQEGVDGGAVAVANGTFMVFRRRLRDGGASET
jgi:uncharacterized protein (TIGR00369 family)